MSMIAAAACLAAGCNGNYAGFSGVTQGSDYSVRVNMDGVDIGADDIRDSIEAILTLVDTSFSGYNRNSILSRRNAGENVVPNREFKELSAIAERHRQESGGAFNIAAAPLFDIWGFGFTRDSLPDRAAVDAAMEMCGKREKLNFNAIAQGYTCDLVGRFLIRHGAVDFIVDIGEILCRGVNPSGKPWSIGIDTPADGNDTPGASLSGIWHSDGGLHGIVTSGNYRKFYIRDGRKYAHTIDPRTGYPVEHDLLSATVVASSATEADALATRYMVIGFEEARLEVESDPETEACLITRDTIWYSKGF